METPSDITAEELDIFLQETDEQIQVLDEDIVSLEGDSSNQDLMQGIFRAAHTIKGSSAMLGHARLSEVAHAVETLLDRMRKGELSFGAEVFDAILAAIDVIKVLKDELVTNERSDVDVPSVIAMLKAVMQDNPLAGPEGTGEASARLASMDEETLDRVRRLCEQGEVCWRVRVDLDKEASWATVRMLQALNAAKECGEVLWSHPTVEDIENERVGVEMVIVLAPADGVQTDALKESVGSIDDIVSVEVKPYSQGEDDQVSKKRDEPEKTGKGGVKSGASSTGKTSQTVRIDVGMLDKFMDLVGELVIERSRIMQVQRDIGSNYGDTQEVRSLSDAASRIYKIIDELHYDIMKARMLPISMVFNGLPRIVRDLARQEQKQVELIVEGKETELDRAVIEQIRDPLVHLLRNSVDHGIEMPAERTAAGKSLTGTIVLSAYQEQDTIMLVVSDDGRGIDVDKVKRLALKKRLVTEEAVMEMSDEKALMLIFGSGLTTCEKATEVSGRGVGLDIVKTNVEAIGGSVGVESEVCRGTTFILKLPLTLTIIQGFLVSSHNNTFVMPVLAIVETMKREDAKVETIMGQRVMRYRDSVIPLVNIGALTGEAYSTDLNDEGDYIVVARSGERIIGLAVGGLREPQEVVVKPLGEYVGRVEGISGAAIMGDGSIALILDVPVIIKRAFNMNSGEGSHAERKVASFV